MPKSFSIKNIHIREETSRKVEQSAVNRALWRWQIREEAQLDCPPRAQTKVSVGAPVARTPRQALGEWSFSAGAPFPWSVAEGFWVRRVHKTVVI